MLQNNRVAEAQVCAKLAAYFTRMADPHGDHSWSGASRRAHQDLVYYQLRALMLPELRTTLGSLKFIRARATHVRYRCVLTVVACGDADASAVDTAVRRVLAVWNTCFVTTTMHKRSCVR